MRASWHPHTPCKLTQRQRVGGLAGAGLSLALACDLRYAAESSRLILAFVRIGLVPDAGALFFLPRLLGPGKSLELAWLGGVTV